MSLCPDVKGTGVGRIGVWWCAIGQKAEELSAAAVDRLRDRQWLKHKM